MPLQPGQMIVNGELTLPLNPMRLHHESETSRGGWPELVRLWATLKPCFERE